MPYAITQEGYFRAVSEGMTLTPDETLCAELPQWVLDQLEVKESGYIETLWRDLEASVVSNQLMALEEAAAGVTVADLLPGTRVQWLSYRAALRAWKEGNPDFPHANLRPSRP